MQDDEGFDKPSKEAELSRLVLLKSAPLVPEVVLLSEKWLLPTHGSETSSSVKEVDSGILGSH